MGEAVARAAINWLFAVSGRSGEVGITFFGGEPLMNKDVLLFAVSYSQRLARLHGKKVFYSMTTNGTLIDDDVVSVIKRYNFGLMVSLDGPRERHDGQCPTRAGTGSFDLAVAGIRRLMARRKRVPVPEADLAEVADILRVEARAREGHEHGTVLNDARARMVGRAEAGVYAYVERIGDAAGGTGRQGETGKENGTVHGQNRVP